MTDRPWSGELLASVRRPVQSGSATLYEIDPGNNGSPFHLHHGNEEMILVIGVDRRRWGP